ncbi:ATP-binding cassette domain-containing protein [Anaerosporobacter sp.]
MSIETSTIETLIDKYPFLQGFLENYRIKNIDQSKTLKENMDSIDQSILQDFGIDYFTLMRSMETYIEKMRTSNKAKKQCIEQITIIGGRNKFLEAENVVLTIKKGEVISIVGPTGSGKSRLLGDIECLAQGDTPTKRMILINNEEPTEEIRFDMGGKLVAQLSQNMNFIMDLSVKDFLIMHAKSRQVSNIEKIVNKIIIYANELAGETFDSSTKVTQLSGGQSRALMIADTALLSDSPIVLIDEIENAGIDRKKAIQLLAKEEKIVLISTHDPIVALLAGKRVVIKNGGIYKVIETKKEEKQNLSVISFIDERLLAMRNMLREGDTIDFNVTEFFSY